MRLETLIKLNIKILKTLHRKMHNIIVMGKLIRIILSRNMIEA